MKASQCYDIHIIAVDQLVHTKHETSANPDIKHWMVKVVGDDNNIADLWKTREGKIEMDSMWFGKRLFDDLYEARDYVQQKYDGMNIN